MPDSLNYQPSNSAVYYRPPERFDRRRMLLGLPIGLAVLVGGSIAYALILPTLKDGIIHIIAAGVAALAVGIIVLCVTTYARMRSTIVAAFLGAVLSIVSLYAMWVTWIHSLIRRLGLIVPVWGLITHPRILMRIIHDVNVSGSWSYNGDMVSGVPLLLIWLTEGGMVIGAGLFAAMWAVRQQDPICPACRSKLAGKITVPKFSADGVDALVAAVESRRFDELLAHDPPLHEHAPEVDLILLSCPECMETHVLSLNRLAWARNKQGKIELKTTSLIRDLMITPVEAAEIYNVGEQIRTQRRAIATAAVVPEESDESEGPDDSPTA